MGNNLRGVGSSFEGRRFGRETLEFDLSIAGLLDDLDPSKAPARVQNAELYRPTTSVQSSIILDSKVSKDLHRRVRVKGGNYAKISVRYRDALCQNSDREECCSTRGSVVSIWT